MGRPDRSHGTPRGLRGRGLGWLERMTEVLGAIEGRKIAVMGNHDWWSGQAGVHEALRAAQVEILDNAWTMDGSGEDAQV